MNLVILQKWLDNASFAVLFVTMLLITGVVWICYLGVNLLGKGLHSYGWFL